MKNKLKLLPFILVIAVFICCSSSPKMLESTNSPVVITVATYNLLNFTDNIDDPDSPFDQDRGKSQKAIDALGEVFKAMNADIIGVEEIEKKELLKDFCNKYLSESKYFISFFKSWDPSGISVGLLTKYPILNEKLIEDVFLKDENGNTMLFNYGFLKEKPIPFSRGILKVTVKIKKGEEVTFYVVHFKAGMSEQSPERRIAEAQALREVVRKEYTKDKNVDFVVLGDFNETPRSNTVKIIEGLDTNMPLRNVFTLSSQEISNKERASHPSYNPYRPIDHIFISPGMVENYVKDSAQVFKHPKAPDVSDHLPVMCKFMFN